MNIPSRTPHSSNLDRVPLNSSSNGKISKLTRKEGTKREPHRKQDSRNGKYQAYNIKISISIFKWVREILLSHKKEWNNAICSFMDGPRDYHSKWSMSDTERQISYHFYVESKEVIQMNLFMKQKETHRCRKQIYGYQMGTWD